MKKTFRNLILIATMAFSFTACKKDKDEPANYFTYEGKKIEIKAAAIDKGDEWQEFIFVNAPAPINPATKISTLIISFAKNEVPAGTYTYKNYNDAAFDKDKNFDYSAVGIDVTFPDYDDGTVNEATTAGTVTIAKDGANYKVTYDITFADGKKVTGAYTGAVISED